MQVSARQAVVETLERVFARHGAVPMDSNTIGFCPVDAPADTAELLSTTGARLAMRCCFLRAIITMSFHQRSRAHY